MTDLVCNLLGAALLLPLGLALGSFLEVVVDRIPRGESVLAPPSHCRACGRRLTPGELVPLVSYLVQRGRCRGCAAPIGPGVPLREALSGAGLALPWAVVGCLNLVAALILGGLLLAVGWAVRFMVVWRAGPPASS